MNIRDSAVETQEALRESRRKDGFLATLCHQLRNQLAPIRHAVYLLKVHERGTENPVQQQAHEIIQRQLANMTKLISDLVEVARVVNGQIGLNPQVVDLNRIVAHAVEAVKPLAEQRRHTLKLVLNPTPVWTHADPGRLEEVFTNLVNNAAKYTADGGEVVVTCHHLRGCNHSEVRVRDNGVGIEKQLLPNIFDLFSESDQSLHRAAGGLGIGLTVAHRLVELHGGTIEVHSPPANAESGSEFIVRLSVAGPPLLQQEQGSCTVSQEAHRGRVLIVDDNADMVAMFSSTLIHRGYAVQIAHTGPDGLLMAEQCQPDVIVLDIGLPGLDGYELARRLRASPNLRKARIIALTGYGQEADIQLALDAGFDAHMVKPYDYEELEKLMFPELK